MKGIVFISCGQSTSAEKQLGKQIAELIRTETPLDAFFADNVQGLNALNSEILQALRHCVAFIVVMHPRGEVQRPDGPLTRASVWIEQEIAIATYVQEIEKRPIHVIPFKHASVGLEGMRAQIALNPIVFSDETEVLAELRKRLDSLKMLTGRIIKPELYVKTRLSERRLSEFNEIETAEYPSLGDYGTVTLFITNEGAENLTNVRVRVNYDRDFIVKCDHVYEPDSKHREAEVRGIIFGTKFLRCNDKFAFVLTITRLHGQPFDWTKLHFWIDADQILAWNKLQTAIVRNGKPRSASALCDPLGFKDLKG